MAVIFNNDRAWGVGLFDFNAPTQGTVPDQFGVIVDAGGATFNYFLNGQTDERIFPSLPANRMLIQTADAITVRVAGTNLTRDGNGELLAGTINTLWFNEGVAPVDAFIFGLAASAAGYRAVAATADEADDLAFVESLLNGNDLVTLSALNDSFDAGSGVDVVFSNAGNDMLTLGSGSDAAVAGRGRDTLLGGNGDDLLIGNGGADQLRGGAQNDSIEGGTGNDLIFGGTGADVFTFRGADGQDTIRDFAVGVDRINVVNGAANFAGIVISAVGGDTYLGIGNTIVILKDVSATSITAASFTFQPDGALSILNGLIQNTDFVL